MISYFRAMCWSLFAAVTISAAVLLTLLRLLLPYAGDYRDEIQAWLGSALGQPVAIGHIEAQWRGFSPSFSFTGIRFLDKPGGQPIVSLDQLGIAIDVPASLLHARLQFGSLVLKGAELSILRRSDGSFQVMGLEEEYQDKDSVQNRNMLLDWLFAQDRLALQQSSISWRDERKPGKPLRFVAVQLQLRNDGERHQLDGSASIPNDLGKRFSFAVDLSGDVLAPQGWDGRLYASGAGLQVGELLNWLPLRGLTVVEGVAEIRLWSEWRKARLHRLDGELSISRLALAKEQLQSAAADGSVPNEEAAPELIDALSGRFIWQRDESGWSFNVQRFLFGRRGASWPPGSLSLTRSDIAGQPRFEFMADYLRLNDIAELLLLTDLPDEQLRDSLKGLRPSGTIKKTRVGYTLGDSGAEYTVAGNIEDFAVHAWKKIPGISGYDGVLVANQDSGVLELETDGLSVDSRSLFRDSLDIENLTGRIMWRRAETAWQIAARDIELRNADIDLRADIDVEWPLDGRSPYMNLAAGFRGSPGSVAHASRYLPAGIMRKPVVDWVDRAIVDGTISSGGLVFQGRMDRFPFDHGDGSCEGRFALQQGILDYLPGWPRIEELETEVVFSGRSMMINAVAGKTLDTKITATHVSIADLRGKPALLQVAGQAQGDTVEALHYLLASPLQRRFGAYLSGADAKGVSRLDLSLSIPLVHAPARAAVKVSGKLSLDNSTLSLANNRVELTQLNGNLGFTEAGLQASGITGKVLGLEAEFSVNTRREKDAAHTLFSAHGNAGADAIAALLNIALFEKFSGRADWQAELRVPGLENAEGADLRIQSDLKGLATNLPEPLYKAAQDRMPLEVFMYFPLTLEQPVRFHVDDKLSGLLDLDEHLKLKRGSLHFGQGEAQLPPHSGVSLAGSIASFSFSKWLPLIESAEEAGKDGTAAQINSIDMSVGDTEVYGRHFSDVSIKATRTPLAWKANVDSSRIAGNIQVPLEDDVPLLMDMQRLELVAGQDESEQSRSDPTALPAARIKSRSFSYDGIDFGSLELQAVRHEAGLRLTQLKLQSPLMNITAYGDWVVVDKRQFSSFNISFGSDNLGKALSRLGYAGSISQGRSTIDIVARWTGSPAAFALERLNGIMKLRIKEGRMLDIEPGAGRVFGLLSLQALPRRLILDFRDVFQKGFRFDSIKGNFDIKDGQATTSNLTMKGPAGRIKAIGRVGLADRDYDQTIIVTPDLASGLPVAGVLASGVGVGAAILFLQKIFEPKIKKISTIKYSITGSWDDPIIKKLGN